MTEKGKMLEGWKSIASFLGVSEKTATRWHKRERLVIRRRGKGKNKTDLRNSISGYATKKTQSLFSAKFFRKTKISENKKTVKNWLF